MGNFNFKKVWWGAIPIGGGGAIAPHAPMVGTALRSALLFSFP